MKNYIQFLNHLFASYLKGLTALLVLILVLKQLYILPFLVTLLHIIMPISVGIVIAYLTEPFISYFKVKRVFACFLVYGILLILIATVIVVIVYPLSIELVKLKEYIPMAISYIQSLLEGTLSVNGISNDTYSMITKGGELLFEQMRSFTSFMAKSGTSLLSAFFISLDKDELIRVFRIQNLYQNTHIAYFLTASSRLLSRYITGMGIDLLFLFLSISILLFFVNFPYFWLYAMILSLLNMIPIIGPTIGFLILMLVAYLNQVPYMWGILFAVWVLQQIEANYIQVIIFKRTMNVLPIYTMTLMILLGYYFGIVGMVVSPILAGMLQIVYKSYELSCSALPTWEDIWK